MRWTGRPPPSALSWSYIISPLLLSTGITDHKFLDHRIRVGRWSTSAAQTTIHHVFGNCSITFIKEFRHCAVTAEENRNLERSYFMRLSWTQWLLWSKTDLQSSTDDKAWELYAALRYSGHTWLEGRQISWDNCTLLIDNVNTDHNA